MDNKKKKQGIICIVILVILVIVILLCLRNCHNQSPPIDSSTTEESDFPKQLDFEALKEQDKITIPAVTGLNMVAEQLNQKVNFYNPDTNNCYFRLSLYLSDDTLLYQSDLLKPTESIKEIKLSQKLKRGIYSNCRLVFDCFTMNEAKEKLNSGTVTLEITAR